VAAVDAGIRLQFRFHSRRQSDVSHHRLCRGPGDRRIAADGLDQSHRQSAGHDAGVLDDLPGAGKADLRGENINRKRCILYNTGPYLSYKIGPESLTLFTVTTPLDTPAGTFKYTSSS